jgi:hypothetical protein
VAIAVGSGSDVALSSASFILVSSNLGGILTLVDLSATVFRRVELNFVSVNPTRSKAPHPDPRDSSCGHWCTTLRQSRSRRVSYTLSGTGISGSIRSGHPLPWRCRKSVP